MTELRNLRARAKRRADRLGVKGYVGSLSSPVLNPANVVIEHVVHELSHLVDLELPFTNQTTDVIHNVFLSMGERKAAVAEARACNVELTVFELLGFGVVGRENLYRFARGSVHLNSLDTFRKSFRYHRGSRVVMDKARRVVDILNRRLNPSDVMKFESVETAKLWADSWVWANSAIRGMGAPYAEFFV